MYSQIILVLGLLPTILLFVTARLDRGGGLGPNPLKVMGWTLLLGYTLKSLYLVYAVRSGAPFVGDWLAFDIIDQGQLAIVGSVIFLIAGYIVGSFFLRGSRVGYAGVPASRIDFAPIYWVFFGISALLMVIFFYQMGFAGQLTSLRFTAAKKFFSEESGVSSALGFLTIGGDFLVILCVLRFACGGKLSPWDPHVIIALFICLCYMMSSRRNGVLVFVILYLLVSSFIAMRNRMSAGRWQPSRWLRPRRSKIKIFGLVTLILLSLTFVGQIRKSDGSELAASDLDIGRAVAITLEQTFQGAYFLDPAKSAAIVSQTREKDAYLYGESFFGVIFAPVPRAIWPEKPNVRIGPYVAQYLLEMKNRSGAPPGGFAELYMNFGILGIVVGGFLLGAMLAISWSLAINSQSDAIGAARYAIAMMFVLLFLSADFAMAFLFYLKYRIAAAVSLRYLYAVQNDRSVSDTVLIERPVLSAT